MKKIIFLFIVILCSITSNAQANNEHLAFKGVPIDGSLKEYVSKMESAGFSYLWTQEETAVLQGDFAGFKGCIIGVTTLKNSDVVNTIGVIFPVKDEWSSLENDYQHLKKMLTEKYGKPYKCTEEFQGYSSPRDNSDKMLRLQMDRCIYVTLFETPKGTIQLSLEHQNVSTCFVKLQYWDKINTNTIKAKVLDDL